MSPIDGYYIDVGCFNSWFYAASEFGVREFYRKVWCDYPPFNVFIFWVFGNLAKHLSLFGTPSTIYVVKLPSNLFDLATSYILFRYLKGKLGDGWALTAATFYLFNPSTIFNSSVWGQFDAVYTFFIVLSLTAILDLKVKLSLMSYALAVLSKPQAIAFFPVLAMFVLFKLDLKRILTAVVSFISTFLVFILPLSTSTLR
ncbi:MAG: glycosyltransferase 87 family protein [Candidatus Bathyarchaeia archaeon]